MRSIVYDHFGDPGEVLEIGERPMPEPGPGEVRIKMTLSPIHNHDLWTIRGSYGVKPPLPAQAGSEAAGLIDALGEGVTGLAVGQRVVTNAPGTWSEYFIAKAQGAIPLPDAIDDETGCQIIAMPLSALMLLEDLKLSSGQWMIQNASTGAVGKNLAILAATRGIKVINLVRREAGIAELEALGIEHGVSTSSEDWQNQVRALIGDAPILRAVDSVGGKESGQMLALLGQGGELISFGSMSGQPMVLSSGDIIFKETSVRGYWGAKAFPAARPEDLARFIGELFQMAMNGTLKLPVDQIFELSQAREAAAASVQPGRAGKVLFKA